MLRTSLKKAALLGLAAVLTVGSGIASAHREDDDDDDDDEDIVLVGGDCENNGNVGINLGLCGLSLPLNLLNILGSNEQTSLAGVTATEDDGDDEGDDEEGGSCENNGNTGINLGLCGLAAPLSLLNILGDNDQTALGGGGDCENNGNVGINLGLCRISLPLNLLNLLGENEQFAATP
ncbi:MAG: hypothetical protein ACRDZ7_16535 [Acidimicrobiia bacterium]